MLFQDQDCRNFHHTNLLHNSYRIVTGHCLDPFYIHSVHYVRKYSFHFMPILMYLQYFSNCNSPSYSTSVIGDAKKNGCKSLTQFTCSSISKKLLVCRTISFPLGYFAIPTGKSNICSQRVFIIVSVHQLRTLCSVCPCYCIIMRIKIYVMNILCYWFEHPVL